VSAVAAAPAAREVGADARVLGWSGVALGLLALFIAIPPLTLRTPLPSLLVAAAGLAAGAWALRGGARRLGWGAVAAAAVGAVGALVATQSGEANLDRVVVWSALAAAMLRFATPLLFAALGGLLSERSGVVNIGLEGMMLMGAFFAAWAAARSGSWVVGLAVGMVAGGALALVHAFFSVTLRADQIVSGFALNLLALGLTGYLYVDVFGEEGTPELPRVPALSLPLEWIPFFGEVLSNLNLLVWLGLGTALAVWVVVFRTPLGLRLRSVGENPRAADTAGLSVTRIRYGAVVASGMLAAVGGAYLSIAFVGSFTQNMTAGRGFLALAALIFGRWLPGGALLACLLFGFASALAQRLPVFSESTATLFQALPYVVTLIAVAGFVGRAIAPAALGRPYERA